MRAGTIVAQTKIELPMKLRRPMRQMPIMKFTLGLVVMGNFLGIIAVMYGMVANVSVSSLTQLARTGETFSALSTTLVSVFCSVMLIVLLGIPVAYKIAVDKSPFYKVVEVVTFIPLVLPPSVAGLGLLMTFGKHGSIGQQLAQWGIHLPFTFLAIVFVQVFVCLPFFIQIVKGEFEGIEGDVVEAAKVFGAGERALLFRIYIPIGLKAIFAGMILCALRAAGEFGATIMFAGNMPGKTQTLTTRIYSLYQYDVLQAVTLAVVQLTVLLIPVIVLKYLTKRNA